MAVDICIVNSRLLTMDVISIRKKRCVNRLKSFCTVFIVCCILLCHATSVTGVDPHPMECGTVKLGFRSRGLNTSDLLSDPVNGNHLRVCLIANKTCCSEATENRLAALSKQQFDRTVRESLVRLSAVLNTRAQRFDEFFRNMLANSKREFHEMFKKTYGVIYVQNSYVFTDLFEELESYYNKGQIDLGEAMDNFFSVLYQRMFTVINSQYHFDEKYLTCVADHMKELKPFGDVPHKLSIQIKRSFVATRTFAKALGIGADVTKNMLGIKSSQECSKSMLRMQHCQACAGMPVVKACSNYCINVMKGCLAYHANLENDWNNYVDAMDKISDRLLGSFNIEMVVQPIDIKISEAVMNFQENGVDVSQRVFSGCGKPVLGRKRRSTNLLRYEFHENLLRANKQLLSNNDDIQFEEAESSEKSLIRNTRSANRELTYETLKFNDKNSADEEKNSKTEKAPHSGKQEGPSLEKLIKDIRHIIKESKRFWGHLPYQICNNEEIAEGPSKEDTCWNGTTIGKYLPAVVGDGLSNQKHNPVVFVDINRQNSLLNEQIYTLKSISNKLMNAYQGMDVEWIDYEETLSVYSSGSGSGDDTDDTEPDPPQEEGSGSSDEKTYTFNPNTDNIQPIFPPPYTPPRETDDVNTPQIPKSSQPKNITSNEIPGSTSAATKPDITLTRAIVTYLFPLVVIWFGGMFSELL